MNNRNEKQTEKWRAHVVARISHDFRTPLATILSSAELLEFYWDRLESQKRNEHLARIKKAVQEMTMLLDDLVRNHDSKEEYSHEQDPGG